MHWTELAPNPIRTEGDFVAFLNQVGVCLWKPAGALVFPNMADQMDLARPEDLWDTWFWKDDLHIAHRLFYGKLLAGRPTFVSNDLLPAVIAAQGDVDPRTLAERGLLSAEALRVYAALVRERRLSVRDLRRSAGLEGSEQKAAFETALERLSAWFQICKVGITGRTRGTYGYIWGLVEEWTPETLTAAAGLEPGDARRCVRDRLAAHGVAPTPAQWRRLFGWEPQDSPDAA